KKPCSPTPARGLELCLSTSSRSAEARRSRRLQGRGRQKETWAMSKGCNSIACVLGCLVAALAWIVPSRADPAADFYRRKSVRWRGGFGPGGGYHFYPRLVAAHLGRHVPGNPTMIVENMPGASSLKAADYVYNQTNGDGTVIGLFLNNFVLAKL